MQALKRKETILQHAKESVGSPFARASFATNGAAASVESLIAVEARSPFSSSSVDGEFFIVDDELFAVDEDSKFFSLRWILSW